MVGDHDQPILGTPAKAYGGVIPLKENSPSKMDGHHPQRTVTINSFVEYAPFAPVVRLPIFTKSNGFGSIQILILILVLVLIPIQIPEGFWYWLNAIIPYYHADTLDVIFVNYFCSLTFMNIMHLPKLFALLQNTDNMIFTSGHI